MKCKFRDGGLCFNSGSRHYKDGCIECECIMPISNADHIRSMTDEGLARFLAGVENRRSAAGGGAIWKGAAHALEWLKQPYKEDT